MEEGRIPATHSNNKKFIKDDINRSTSVKEMPLSNGTMKNISDYENENNRKARSRTTLPCHGHSLTNFSVWSILKQCIGKDLSKITMPVIFNEPLSFLQRIVEYLEYAELLKKASESNDPVERLEYVTAFAASGSPANHDRLGKPFNPLLGETYELERDDLGFKVFCEQVSHHPPVSAFHAESSIFALHGSVNPKIRFWGKSIEITPKGILTLHLLRHNEVYTWSNVNCCVHNIIVGKLWLEMYGALEVTNHKTRHRAVLNFKPCGWFGKDLNKTVGYIYDEKKTKVRALYGKWTEGLYSCPVNVWDEYQAGNLSSNPNPVSNDGPTSEFHTPANGSSFEDANDVKFNFTDNDSASTLPASLEYDGKTVEKSDSKALLVGNATAVTETRTGNGSAMKTSASAPAGVGNPPDKISKDKTDLADKLKALCVMDNESSDEDGEEEFEDALSSPEAPEQSTDCATADNVSDCDLRLPGQKNLWIARPKAPEAKKYYNFTMYAMSLNELDSSLREKIAPTDSRFRQDMRYMEEGNLDASAAEKLRLEDKQRAARKSQRHHSDESKPKWFKNEYNQHSRSDDWVTTNEYWKRDWKRCPKIF